MATIHDIARVCGVSTATVSRALNGDPKVREGTRRKVLAVARKKGFQLNPAGRQLRTGRSNTLGLIIPSFSIWLSEILMEMLRGLGSQVESFDFRLLLLSLEGAEHDKERPARFLEQHKFDGLIFFEQPRTFNLESFKRFKVPHILVNSEHPTIPYVASANRQGLSMAVEHLVSLGHRRIGYLGAETDNKVAYERLLGYRDGLKKAKLPFDAKLVVTTGFGDYLNRTTIQEERLILDLLEGPRRPTALVCVTAMIALAAYRAAAKMNLKIPRDLSVVGFDDIWPSALCEPALTTVVQSPYEVGRKAAVKLVEQIEEGKPMTPARVKAVSEVVPTSLAVRDSSAPPNSSKKTRKIIR